MSRRMVARRRTEFAQHVEELSREAGGAYRLEVFLAENFLPAIMQATEPLQIRALQCLGQLLHQIGEADSSAGPMCLTCDAVLHGKVPPRAIAVLLPLRDDATTGLGFGLCRSCCAGFGTGQGLSKAILTKLRDSLISDLREIPHPAAGGRA